MQSILYIFLPCKKVYPIGVTYLADFIHRRKPEVRQRILTCLCFPNRSARRRFAMPRSTSSRISFVFPGGTFRFFLPTKAMLRWSMRSISISPAIPSSV